MTSLKKRKSTKLLAICLSACMLTAVAGTISACGSSSPAVDDSEVSLTKKDTGHIKNAGFELDKDTDTNLIITAPTGWTKSTDSTSKGSAVSSKAASGIVNTTEEAWNRYTETSGLAHSTEAEAKANWANLTVRDKLEFIRDYKDADSDNNVKDLSFYDKDDDAFNYNVAYKDLPDCENPGTHNTSETEDTHVLMLHNKYTDNFGTAQKYTSSTSVTVEVGTTTMFSVWVKTANLTTSSTAVSGTEDVDKKQNVVSDRGAYISVTNSVGGNSLDPVMVKNINTAGVTDNNGWQQYTFYLVGSTYTSTTFTIVLGLGVGGSGNKWEYVDGYAFFDDIECTTMSNEVFTNEYLPDVEYTVHAEDLAADKLLATDSPAYKDKFKYAINLSNEFSSVTLSDSYFTAEQTKTEAESAVDKEYDSKDILTGDANDLHGLYTLTSLKGVSGNEALSSALTRDFTDYPFTNEDILMLFSKTGAPYTVKMQADSLLTVPSNSYKVVSFMLRTSVATGFTGAGITLKETGKNEQSVFTSLSTADITEIELDKGTTYTDWQKCFIFLSNETDNDIIYSLKFTYGPTAITATTTKKDFTSGYAAFADFTQAELSKDEYNRAATSTYAAKITLGSEDEESKTSFDSPKELPTDIIETGFAQLKNYTGVYGGSGYVVYNGENKDKNAYPYAGLLDSEYADTYNTNRAELFPNAADTFITNALTGAGQPLFIYNYNEEEPAIGTSYGYIGSSQSIAASTYSTVSLRVKASMGATANIYLIDMSKNAYDESISLSTLQYIYWYDADGNVCVSDPTANSFKSKEDVAFYLNDNGLYEVNKRWANIANFKDLYESYKGKLYANLSAYEKDENGNLLVNENGVSYNYNSNVRNNEGNDGIAFYAKEENGEIVYYAHKNFTDRVYDLKDVQVNGKSIARYAESQEKKSLTYSITGTGDWETYTFYIHTGSTEMKYRLEVWSGSRDGSITNENGSYVMFETISRAALTSTTAESLISDVRDDRTEEAFKNDPNVIYTVYSFYDTDRFLRYDKSIDKNNIGNLYKSYDSTSYEEGVAYFYYENVADNSTMTYMDFAYTDVTVSPDSTTDNSSSDSSSTSTETNNEANIWLLVSSLVLAVVLVFAIVSLIVQRIIKKKGHHAPRSKKEKVNKSKKK